ncbi:MAG TPA: MFS transporter [Blastocatellia bacterium]|nr:MFS transporter [Blastocatellia bacterium]
MAKSRSPLVIIFITIFIDLVGFGIVIPVLPLYAARFGASPTVIGLLLSVYSVMQFIFAPVLGRLSDRVGRRPVLLVSMIGTSFGFMLMGLAGSLELLFLARIIDGITGANISTAQAYIADVTPPEQRSRGMGLIGAAFGLGFIVGPAIGGVMSQVSLAAPFYFAAGLAAANAVALSFLLPESLSAEHRIEARRRATILQVFRESGSWQLAALMATYFFATVSFALLTAIYALFTRRRFGYDATHNGYIFAFLGLLGAIIQGGLLGRLLSLFSDKTLAVAGTLVMTASMFALPESRTVWMLLAASTGIAIGNSLVTPTLNGLASRTVSAAWQGRMLGVLQSVASLARIIGPVLGGVLLDRDLGSNLERYGRSPLWTGGAIMLLAAGLALTVTSPATEVIEQTPPLEPQRREEV